MSTAARSPGQSPPTVLVVDDSPSDQLLAGKVMEQAVGWRVVYASSGIEALAAMKSTDDAPAIAALGTSRERLVGYWGEEQGRDDPTLGQRAKELAASLGGK